MDSFYTKDDLSRGTRSERWIWQCGWHQRLWASLEAWEWGENESVHLCTIPCGGPDTVPGSEAMRGCNLQPLSIRHSSYELYHTGYFCQAQCQILYIDSCS